MFVIRLLFLLLLAGAASSVLLVLVLALRSVRKRRLLADAHATSCDTLDGIGVSVLCSGVNDLEQVENLLSTEYSRYEVVLVLDSRAHPEEFSAIASRYRMISVNYLSSWEVDTEGVRGLYRSRQRCFRRLVLVDREQGRAEDDFDAALGVSTYDYLLPLYGGYFLMPDAVERLVVEVSECPPGSLDVIHICLGMPAKLYARESVIAEGGFVMNPARRFARGRSKRLWEPLLCTSRPMSETVESVYMRYDAYRPLCALLLVAAGGVAAWSQWWTTSAALLAIALLMSVAHYLSRLFPIESGGACTLSGVWRSAFRRIGRKKFTIS